jgi:DNA polymerase III subunit alpha
MFNHLHTHSHYSLLESLPSPEDLARKASKFKMEALALTDHNLLTGAIEFYEVCKSYEVKPILGLEIDLITPKAMNNIPPDIRVGKLVLLAINMIGWSNLCRISSKTELRVGKLFEKGIDFEFLADYSDGLICLSGGYKSVTTSLLRDRLDEEALSFVWRLAEIFNGRLYLEIQSQTVMDQKINPRFLSLARRLNIPVVATHNVYYLAKEDQYLQRLLTAIRHNRNIGEIDNHYLPPPGSWLVSPAEMVNRFSEIPEAIQATMEITDRCQLVFPEGVSRYPQITFPDGVNPIQVLREKAYGGARQKYGFISTDIESRLEYELQVIQDINYTSLFLIMEEIVRFARRRGIPISSRGSAASSLVAYCLGITTPDPIKYGLYFERFLNPARTTPPDFDTDICSRRRDEIIDFVFNKFGEKQAAMVCTINRLRRRSALGEVAKAHGLSSNEMYTLKKLLSKRRDRSDLFDSKAPLPYEKLKNKPISHNYDEMLNQAKALIGIPDHLSIHPGGLVIAPGDLEEIVPTQKTAKGVKVTQFDLQSIEKLGLVKIDLLGIRGLTVIGEVLNTISKGQSGDSQKPVIAFDIVPEEDDETGALLKDGRTIGCFQIESPGMRATLKEIQAHNVDDLIVALSLYRPGPLSGGLKDAFVRRYRREENISYLHPALEPILKDTFGVILYQEQVLRIANELAGLSPSEADILRRAMSHFDPGQQMESLKAKFIEGVYMKHSVPNLVAEEIWNLMAAFAGYGFPKAHAASYAQVAWRSAWCKAHFPALFMASVLANWGGYYSQRVYLSEARRLGLAVKPPLVQYAMREFSVKYHEGEPILYMGLDQVRALTKRTQTKIINSRPFNNFQDFLIKVDPRPIEIENLIKSGSMQNFGTIPNLIHQIGQNIWKGGQIPMFTFEGESESDWSLQAKAAAQEEILGVSISSHPVELIVDKIKDLNVITTEEAATNLGEILCLVGIKIMGRLRSRTRGKPIYHMVLEDLDGVIDVIVPDDVYRRYRSEINKSYPMLVEGMVEVEKKTGEPFLRAKRILAINSE